MTPIVFVEAFDAQDEAPAAFDDADPDVVLSPPDGAATRVAAAVGCRRRLGRHRLRQVLGHHTVVRILGGIRRQESKDLRTESSHATHTSRHER
jgi:hypothetical protein